MIIIGCLSVVAGVLVAYLHHHGDSGTSDCSQSTASLSSFARRNPKVLVVNHDSKGNYMKPFDNPNDMSVDDLVRTTVDSPAGNARDSFHRHDDLDANALSGSSMPHSELSDIIRRLHNGHHVCPTCGVTTSKGSNNAMSSVSANQGDGRDWKRIAAVVDRCMFCLCFILTLTSMVITFVMFFITTDEHLEEDGHHI